VIPYGRQSIDSDDIEAVAAVLAGDWLTTGPAVERFERAIEELVGGGVQAATVTSGTAALHVAYAAARVSGGSVITTPLTFVATAATAVLQGAAVVFADVEERTGNLDPRAVEAVIDERTSAVAAVDYAGVPVDAAALGDLAHAHGALLVEDAAHAIGSLRDGEQVGRAADLTTFSFFPTKNLTTAEGGAVLARDSELVRRMRSFKNHGLVRDPAQQRHSDEGPWHQEVHEFGLNYRLPDVLAALGTSQLSRLAAFKSRRAQIHERYTAAFSGVDGLVTPYRPEGTDPTWHLYPLRVPAEERRRMFDALRADGVGVQVNYIPAYWHPVFEDLGYQRGMCPVAEAYYASEISLPLYYGLTDDDVDRVIESVLEAIGA
jgi:dTDP-4-amino-4,6-dideoxygalactose transaminase